MTRPTTTEDLARALDPLAAQLAGRARRILEKHGPLSGPHHAYGVIAEEVAEFFDETRKKRELRSPLALKAELLDIATVALRYAAQLDHEIRQASMPPTPPPAAMSVGSSSAPCCVECGHITVRAPHGVEFCPNCTAGSVAIAPE